MQATISITEQQLEALNQLVTSGLYCLDDWHDRDRSRGGPRPRMAITDARQALVAAQEREVSQ